MEREKLKELLIEHKRRFLSRGDFIRREVQGEINNYIPQRENIVITGVRRSGKSTLLRLICDDILTKMEVPEPNILYLNFEDERFGNERLDSQRRRDAPHQRGLRLLRFWI